MRGQTRCKRIYSGFLAVPTLNELLRPPYQAPEYCTSMKGGALFDRCPVPLAEPLAGGGGGEGGRGGGGGGGGSCTGPQLLWIVLGFFFSSGECL